MNSFLQSKPYRSEYRHWGIEEVICEIVRTSDRNALEELLSQRYVTCGAGGPGMRIPEYVDHLYRQRLECQTGKATEIWDGAYNLTLDKFSRLPRTDSDRGVDCRRYYRAFIKKLRVHEKSAIDRESALALALARFVSHHFYLSYLEARRKSNPLVSRYTWNVDGRGKVSVILPKSLSGKQRRLWLNDHVPDADPRRPGERARIQAIIDRELGLPHVGSLDALENFQVACATAFPDQQCRAEERPSFVRCLAKEKAASVDLQRPAIRALGATRIEQLVLTIMDSFSAPQVTFESIAKSFGLSKAALSRFAGKDWIKQEASKKRRVSDLWRNAAHFLSTSAIFRETALEYGVLKVAAAISADGNGVRLRENQNE